MLARPVRRWFEKGLRPRGLRDLRHQAVYRFGAVCPERDAGVALVLPPELNAIERVWLYLRASASSRIVSGPATTPFLDSCCAAWNALLAATRRIRSLCTLDWATVSF